MTTLRFPAMLYRVQRRLFLQSPEYTLPGNGLPETQLLGRKAPDSGVERIRRV